MQGLDPSRIWANLVMTRYGVPPVLALRPRPLDAAYEGSASACMGGDHKPLAVYIRKLYDAKVSPPPPVAKKTAAKRRSTKPIAKKAK